jgi:uncharacterized membrane protein YdjX (TVP38/TMEM64 family)
MSKWQKIFLLCLLIVIIILIRWSNVHHYLNFNFFKQYNIYLTNFVRTQYVPAVLLYILIGAISVIFFVPVTPFLNLASGYYFGFVPAVLYSVLASTIGATASVAIFRYLLKGFIQERFKDRLAKFNREIEKHGAKYLLFLQLLPVTPFGVIIVLAACSAVSLFTFMWTTAVGITPGCMVYAYAGRQLLQLKSHKDLWSPQFILALLLLTALAFLPLIARIARRKKNVG